MNTIWSLSKSSRYAADHSHNVLAILAVAVVVQVALAFQASSLLMPAASAVPACGTVLSVPAPAHGALVARN
jgi:hypothetical protein